MHNRTAKFRECLTMQGGLAKPQRQRSEFARQFKLVSTRVAQELARTLGNLDRLVSLVDKSSMFVNNDSEIHGLQKMIKDTIPVHRNSIQQLEDIYREGSYDESEQHQRHAKTVVKMLKMKLAEVSKQFKGVSDARESKQVRNRERRGQLTGSSMNGGRNGNQGAISFEDMPSVFGGLQGPTADTVVDVPAEAVQTLALLQNDEHLAAREIEMSELESTVTEVQSIFIEMAKLIASQGEMVERIDDNVDDAERSVEKGHGELVKALANVTSNKWLMMKIFGLLLGFFILFVVVFA